MGTPKRILLTMRSEIVDPDNSVISRLDCTVVIDKSYFINKYINIHACCLLY